MSIKDWFRRFKPAYSIYNFFHKKELNHIAQQYDKLGIEKKYFEAVNSFDFKNIKAEKPWLDEQDSKELLPSNNVYQSLNKNAQNAILNWSDKGYAIIPDFFNIDETNIINKEIERMISESEVDWQRNSNKMMFAFKKSQKIKNILYNSDLDKILSLLLGKPVQLFQSINFLTGSQQKTHSDSIHMTTFPLGYLIAVWIALEDIEEGSGVLHYYEGSHKLPYVLKGDFEDGGSRFLLGKNAYLNYENKIEDIIAEKQLKKKTFLAKKGDILIWHANLLHGGNPITQKESTRKSMVLHYYAEGVACYHEITQRPALISK